MKTTEENKDRIKQTEGFGSFVYTRCFPVEATLFSWFVSQEAVAHQTDAMPSPGASAKKRLVSIDMKSGHAIAKKAGPQVKGNFLDNWEPTFFHNLYHRINTKMDTG